MTLVTERETKYYEKLILGKMDKLLSHAEGHTREVLDPESGRDYICSVCDLPLKPCLEHFGYLCCVALKSGTELQELEMALARVWNGQYGLCIRCGRKILNQHLKNHPTALYCNPCSEKISTGKQNYRRKQSRVKS